MTREKFLMLLINDPDLDDERQERLLKFVLNNFTEDLITERCFCEDDRISTIATELAYDEMFELCTEENPEEDLYDITVGFDRMAFKFILYDYEDEAPKVLAFCNKYIKELNSKLRAVK